MQLKSEYNLSRVQAIEAELAAKGIPTAERIPTEGEAFPFRVVTPREAFYRVCDMLSTTRRELWETQEKYRNFRNVVLCYSVALLFIAGMWICNLSSDKKDLQAEISALETQVAELETNCYG